MTIKVLIMTAKTTISTTIVTTVIIQHFPAHDELGTCRTSLVIKPYTLLCCADATDVVSAFSTNC